tara:strand:+ start:84187 stop:85536 length:1350 start_codon:yes stop_codon:yes gene_type:complete
MSSSRNLAAAIALGATLSIASCSSLPSFGNNKAKEKSAEDKAGRITMILADEAIKPNPELADVTIELPEPQVITAWTEAGANATKVVGNVSAGADLKIAWKADVGAKSGKKSAITTPPVTNETTVFTMDADQTVVATNLSNGKQVWKKKLKGLTKRDKQALGGGLAVTGDTLIVASGYGFVSALDAASGTEKWKHEMGAPMTGAPTIKDGRIFVASNNNEIFALSLANGETEWSDQAISESARVLGSSSPAAIEDFLIAPYSSGEIIAYLASNGRRLWTDAISQAGRFTPISEINDIGSRPVLSGGLVFASSQSGVTVAIDGRSGTRIWSIPTGSTQAPALAGGFMFIIGVDDTLSAINPANGEAYWVTPLRKFKKEKKKKGRISYAGPMIASGRILVVSSLGELLAFSPQTGQQTDSVKLGSTAYLEPIAVQDKLLILTDEAKLIAIQ